MDINGAKQFILQKQEAELPKYLTYHSIHHIHDVYEAVCRHIEAVGLQAGDALLLQTAALFHDSGFMVQAQGHEEISCSFAQEYLPGFGYSKEQVEAVCGMIRATKIPQTPYTPLEEILADADLDYLGRDDFKPISNSLFEELKYMGAVANEQEWNQMQVRFFESHHYFTPQAKAWREAKKEENLTIIKQKLTNRE
jgi:predicted metal-dependent HD superfamily phosphohydrolase